MEKPGGAVPERMYDSADCLAVADNLLRQSPTAFPPASPPNPSPPLFNDPVPSSSTPSTAFNSNKFPPDVDPPLALNHQQPFLTFFPPPSHIEMGKYPPNSHLQYSMPLLPWPDHHNYALFQTFDNAPSSIRSTPHASSAADKHSFLADPSSAGCIGGNTFHFQLLKQEQEILQIFELYEEHLSQALQERRETHTNALLALVDQCVCRCVREKEAEIARLQTRNVELENLVKQMSFESQVWQNVARNNEAVATNLRNNLEQLVVQCREIKEGSGESEAEDMESCIYRGSGEEGKDLQLDRQIAEKQRKCRFCRTNGVSILFLPCKHLCVCEGCDARYDECPLCRQPKSASVKVYLE